MSSWRSRRQGARVDPLVSVWPAVVEAMYLLDAWQGQAALWDMIEAAPSRPPRSTSAMRHGYAS